MDDNDKLDKDKYMNSHKDHDDYEEVCYLCRRPESTAGKMVHIPNNISICSDCMQKTFDTINKGDNPYFSMMGISPDLLRMTSLKNDIGEPQKLKKKKQQLIKKLMFTLKNVKI